MKQKQEQLHKVREKLLDLIKNHPNSHEAARWKQMLTEIGIHKVLPPDGPEEFMSLNPSCLSHTCL